ncbi:MAG: hypothetical protein LBR53_06350 [Deltaproteobacteria bacterium]|jgi:hypothetical protein|nr:hypothetical protein [Deltaproteobacteria bacterium]
MKIETKKRKKQTKASKRVQSGLTRGSGGALDSSQIKTAILSHFRFELGWIYFSTEVSEWKADILMIDPSENLVEVEVKVSLADFKADFKKKKHEAYESPRGNEGVMPNKFYFAAPKSLEAGALSLMKERPLYGLLTVDESSGAVRTAKRAGLLNGRRGAGEKAKRVVVMRMGSELISLRRERLAAGNPEFSAEEDVLDLAPYEIRD